MTKVDKAEDAGGVEIELPKAGPWEDKGAIGRLKEMATFFKRGPNQSAIECTAAAKAMRDVVQEKYPDVDTLIVAGLPFVDASRPGVVARGMTMVHQADGSDAFFMSMRNDVLPKMCKMLYPTFTCRLKLAWLVLIGSEGPTRINRES